jgi:DNA helicase-2/ATP-dependent DNA helicase PcrA
MRTPLTESAGIVRLEEVCPSYFDTLKFIRLVRPRLRRYKLGHLLEVLGLEGQNSHQADDDIMATLSLLNFCLAAARRIVPDQQLFMADHNGQIERFQNRYREIYLGASHSNGIIEELQRVYNLLLDQKVIDPIDKWNHLLHYLDADVVRSDLYPTLGQQLTRYITDLNTSKEADMCGGSLREQYIISTVHKAKGLEFDTVVVYRAIDGNYPSTRSWTEKQIEEDARKLFVALTRSRRRLCVVYDEYYGRSVHALSPFLEKVKGHFTLYRRDGDGKIRECQQR